MDDLLREFLAETAEGLAQLDVELVEFEQNPNNPALLSSIFRVAHTIKGTCGFLTLPRLEHLAHAGENILGKFREGKLPVTQQSVSLILRSLDAIKNLLSYLEQHGAEPAGDDKALIAELNAMAEGKIGTFAATSLFPAVEEYAVIESTIANQSIRVGVDVLENLMTTVSELVLTRNQLLQILRAQKETTFETPLQRLNQVTSELQESMIKTRMQPVGNAWAKLPRIVRDLAVELGKKIDLQMTGSETELDRQVLEMIKDPLTHMVRNSCDHGIETPTERMKAGKPETGAIRLNAYHEGGRINIEIADDGRGLAIDKIRAKAVQSGLTTEAELTGIPDQQILQFIFRPGFSTASQVSAVSGRGVGMDVVRINIEKIGGTIEMKSTPGKGSCFLIKIPLTLAIMPALIVECGKERFAVPQISVLELVQTSADSEHRIEMINETPVLRLRNRLLPLISLRTRLKLGSNEISSDGTFFIVVVQTGTTTFGLIVDRVFDTEEIVVKPVSPFLNHLGVFSGNTILGDGSVIMILDLNGIVQTGSVESIDAETMARTVVAAEVMRSENIQSLLLFRAGGEAPKAVPLSLIARLENIDRQTIEYSSGTPMVQYRGKLMPLVPAAVQSQMERTGMQPILVFSDRDRSMGLIVDEIIDIIEEHLKIDLSAKKPGLLGTSIIAGKATDVIDATFYLSQAYKDWFNTMSDGAYGANSLRRVLLVDDSSFFRNLLTPLLTVAGYNVTAVESPAEALKLQDAGEDFDAIVSDIEMPQMNGFDFAVAVRREGRWSKLPMLALSSHATQGDFERGRAAGFTDYIAKFNRDALIASLKRNLGEAVQER